MWNDLRFRLRALFRPNDAESDLDAELRFHTEHDIEKLMRSGLDRQQAERQARLASGGIGHVKEECRQARGLSALETALQDLRYTVRGMRRNRAFTIAAVLTLGLGAGAISTVFTLANTLFLRWLPVDRPDRVVVVQATRQHGRWAGWVSYPDYARFRDQNQTLEGLAAHYSTAPLFVSAANRSQELNGAVVSANYFPMLRVQPALGRFAPEEDRVPGRDRVAVIGYDLWRNWFASSPGVLGATMKINGHPFTVIGVTPRAFRGVTVQPNEVYIPTMMGSAGYRWCSDALAADCTVFAMIGRLREGATIEHARAEMAALMPESWATAKEGDNSGVTAFPARGVEHPDIVLSSEYRFIKLLGSVAAVLLLVCCINLAGLLIARNAARTREFAIRISLGAGGARLLRQLTTESLLLGLAGGALGLLFSLFLTSGLNSRFYSLDVEGRPLYYDFSPEPRVLAAVVILSIVAGMLAGLLPALQSIRSDAAERLKRESTAVSSGRRLGRWLAGAQTAVAVALAALAALLTASAHGAMSGANFELSHVALLRLRPRLIDYPADKAQQYLRTVIQRLEALPGVESASMTGTGAVLVGSGTNVSLPGWPVGQVLKSGYGEIAPRYFETLRIPLLRGREFDPRDGPSSPAVAIVSETLARRLWPEGSVIGAPLLVNGQPRQVIGIVQDVPLQTRNYPQEPYAFTPFWQNPKQLDARMCVRVKGDPAAMLPELSSEVYRVDPDVPVTETITLSTQLAGAIRSERITASFVSYAAILAVLLSAVGLYGTLAFSVSRRTREIGLRMAIGARPSGVLAMVVREGMTVVLVGVVSGVALAIGATRWFRHLLFGPDSGDLPLYAIAALVAAVVGLLASWIPARRAASVEPIVALREQ